MCRVFYHCRRSDGVPETRTRTGQKTAPENTVNICNIKEHEPDVGFNLIFPLTKLLVYNMDQIFALPDLIDYDHVSNIQFDGETFWISAK